MPPIATVKLMPLRLLVVFAGGGCGSVARYLVGLYAAEYVGASFPWGTLIVNIAGSFLIGVLGTLADEQHRISADVRALLIVGVLGGFTTFSSFSLEAWRLFDGGQLARAASYVLASLVLSFAAVALGVIAARAV